MGAFWGMVKLWIKFTKVELKSAVRMKAHNGVLQRETKIQTVCTYWASKEISVYFMFRGLVSFFF